MGATTKPEEPAVGIPYAYPAQVYYAGKNPYQAGMIPPDAIFEDPKGVPLRQTFFRDSPAPFCCVYLRSHQHQIKTKSGSRCRLHDAIHARSLLPLPFNGLLMA
ncbi:hypothetical protein QJS10_CPA16g00859 [Acorus calamus]|uniref:Uncharacterized protein n=1 Tax=Acorus calamus TaxID=4465 RepID=A0AAV9D0L6_ACOCL|nr:hypothetical protein QJS10_CPA16g00859 [Acorus calamus]